MIQSIRKNITAMESLRNIRKANEGVQTSMERISSGYKTNSAGDDPSNIVLAGMINNQVNSIDQAIKNNEIATMFVQTAEASLNEVSEMLIRIRQLAVHASNEAVNDDKSLAADQAEIDNLLYSINQISDMTQFGNRNLLDGSNGTNAFAVGNGMLLLESTEKTQNSPADGYDVNIEKLATRGFVQGSRTMTAEEIEKGGIFLEVEMGGRHISYTTKSKETPQHLKNILQRMFDKNAMPLDISLDENGILKIQNRDYGSGKNFTVANSIPGIITNEEFQIEPSSNGEDIVGSIGGYKVIGKGQELIAEKGSPIEGIKIKYDGELNLEKDIEKDENGNIIRQNYGNADGEVEGSNSLNQFKGGIEGKIYVQNNSLFFHIGAGKFEHSQIDLKSSRTTALGQNTENESGFENLYEIQVIDFQKAQDTLRVVDSAISEIASMRARIGAVQSNVFERNRHSLAQNFENLSGAKAEITDTDVAKEISELTKNKMWLESTTSLLSNNNSTHYGWLGLLRN